MTTQSQSCSPLSLNFLNDMKLLFPCTLLLLLFGCSSNSKDTQLSPLFSDIEGVERVSDSLAIYQYKDTLYYFNEASECLFKIPYGFKYAKGSDWDVDGLHFWNNDSTITISLSCLDRGYPIVHDDYTPGETEIDILSQVACDNADVRMYYDISDKGYLKVGFTPDFKPMLEKCIAYYNNEDDMINEHLHIIRLVYPDSLAKQAFNINFNYIEPWPNNFYK